MESDTPNYCKRLQPYKAFSRRTLHINPFLQTSPTYRRAPCALCWASATKQTFPSCARCCPLLIRCSHGSSSLKFSTSLLSYPPRSCSGRVSPSSPTLLRPLSLSYQVAWNPRSKGETCSSFGIGAKTRRSERSWSTTSRARIFLLYIGLSEDTVEGKHQLLITLRLFCLMLHRQQWSKQLLILPVLEKSR